MAFKMRARTMPFSFYHFSLTEHEKKRGAEGAEGQHLSYESRGLLGYILHTKLTESNKAIRSSVMLLGLPRSRNRFCRR